MGDLLDLTGLLAARGQRHHGLLRGTPATDWYEQGCALEGRDPLGAAQAYGRALGGRPDLADAHNNLGRILHERATNSEGEGTADLAAAESHYRLALCGAPGVALYWFNLGVVVEDRGRASEAIAAYEQALELDPTLQDAHWNLARLYEQAGRRAGDELVLRRAVRHLVRYRALEVRRVGDR